MSAEIATIERVRDAVAALREKGVRPTAARVIAAIGGGSKSTVLQNLRALRDEGPMPEEIPTAVMDLVRPSVVAVFRAGRAAEAEKVRGATERLSLFIVEQDEQIAELASDNARLEQQISGLMEELGVAEATANNHIEALAEKDAEIASLRAQLLDERRSVEAGMQSALARMETLLSQSASKQENIVPSARRDTLTLPRAKRPDQQKG